MGARIGLFAVAAIMACSTGIIGPGLAPAAETSGVSGWREIAWPFPRDSWEPGRAFECASESCDGEIVYLRPKIGFCNCTTAVSDDDEVDRVTDLDLIDPDFKPLGEGKPVEAAGLRGRARQYGLLLRDGSSGTGVGIALSRKCDVVVAIAQSRSIGAGSEQTALNLLSMQAVRDWIEAGLDGGR